MTLAENVEGLATRIATEFKTVRGTIGVLTALTTTSKSSIISAINEVNAKAGGADVVKSSNATAHRYTVANNATPPGAPNIGDVWTVLDVGASVQSSLILPGQELDAVEVAVPYDVMTNANNVQTDIPGYTLIVPPTPRPYLIRANVMGSMGTGTSAPGTGLSLLIKLVEHVSAVGDYGFGQMTVVQRGSAGAYTAGQSYTDNRPIVIERRFPPSTITRFYKLTAAQSQGTPVGWGSTQIYAQNSPASGPFTYPPNTFMAVSL